MSIRPRPPANQRCSNIGHLGRTSRRCRRQLQCASSRFIVGAFARAIKAGISTQPAAPADDGHIWSLSLITGTIWHRFLMLGGMMVTTMMTMRMRNTNINWYLFQCMRVTVDEDDCWLRDPRGLACFSSTEYCRDICDNEMKLYEMTTMSIDRKIRKYANACIETMVRFQPA